MSTLHLQFIIIVTKEEVRPHARYEISSESGSPFSLRIRLEGAQPLQLLGPAAQRTNAVLDGANASSAQTELLSLIPGAFGDPTTSHRVISMKSTEVSPLHRAEKWNQPAIKEFTAY